MGKITKLQFPIEYIQENIIFTKNDCYAAFKFKGFEYNALNTDEKFNALDRLHNLIKGIPSKGKILLIPREVDSRHSLEPMIKKIQAEDPLKDVATMLLEKTIETLDDRAKDRYIFDDETGEEIFVPGSKDIRYDNYIFISIKEAFEGDFITKGGELLEYLVQDPMNAFNKVLGVSDKYISDTRFKYLKRKSNDFLDEQKSAFDIRPLTKSEIVNLYARTTKRGSKFTEVGVNLGSNDCVEIEDDNEGLKIPVRDYVKNKIEGKIKQKNRMIEVDHGDYKSYQSFLSIVSIPSIAFPGGEYIKFIQDMGIGAEICLDINKLSFEDSKRKISTKDKQFESQIKDASEGGHEVDDDVIEAKVSTENFSKEVRENKSIVEVSMGICIASTNEKQVRNITKELIQDFKKMEFEVVNPLTDQYKLFLEFMPGIDRCSKDFVELMSMKTLAGGIFGSNDQLGDDRGNYIGYTNSNKKVYLYMGRAPQENKSPAMTLYGNLGYGKSFNANLIMMLHILSGSSGLIIDPKSERGHWKKSFDFMGDLISIVRFTANDEDKGKLDPFVIFMDNIEAACDLALSVVMELASIKHGDTKLIALKEALIKIKKEERPSMQKLIELLENSDKEDAFANDAYILARELKTNKGVGLSKLIFGDGTEEAIQLDNRLNILQIDNLQMPNSADKENYTEAERVSSVLMMILGSFTKKFAMKKRETFDVILFEESWFLKDTVEGIKLYNFLTRQGRSLNVGCIFNGHSVLDIPSEEVKNTITYKLCFNTSNKEEAKRMLEYMNMEVCEENIEKIMKLENRQAILKDLDGRTGIITFDAIFDFLIDTFRTTPEDTLEE